MYFSTQNDRDPCIIICLREWAVHQALTLNGAPVQQGADATESGQRFGLWLYGSICNAIPLTRPANGVVCNMVNNISFYYREVLTGMNQDQLFAQQNTPVGTTANWSLECEAQGLLLGHVFTVGKQGINLIFTALHGSSVDDQARNAIRGAVPTKACKLLGS